MKVHLIISAMILALLSGCSGASRDDLVQEGTRKVEENNYRGAVVLFKSVLEKNEEDLEARFLLADAYLRAGKLDLAEKEFARVAARQPAYAGLAERRAELYLQARRPDEACEEIERVIASRPADESLLALLGRAELQRGNPARAEEKLQEALRLAPADRSIRLKLADALARGGKDPEARTLLQQLIAEDKSDPGPYRQLAGLENARGQSETALALFRQAADLDPDDLQSRYSAGLLLLEKGDAEEAQKIAADILRRFPEAPRGLQLQGFLLYLQGRHDESAAHLQRTAEQYPDLLTFYVLGLNYFRLGKTELAVTQFQRILDYRPEAAQPRVVLALILLRQNRTDDAIIELQRALQFNDRNALAHHALGSAFLAKGWFDQAMVEFDRALDLDPELAEAHLQKGLFTLSRGDIDEGEGHLVQALAVAPDIPNIRLILAGHYLRRKNYPEAVRTLREGLTGKEPDCLLYNYLAAASFGQEKIDEAVGYLEKAKKINPGYLTPYYNLATYYAAAGKREEAVLELRAILASNPAEAKAWLLQAQMAEQDGRPEEALACYGKARDTGKMEGYIGLAGYLFRRQDFRGALAVLDEGLSRDPANVEALELKGRLLLGAKAYPEAVGTAETMKARFPDQPAGYLLLADILDAQGERAQALRNLESAPAPCRQEPRLQLKRAELLEKGNDLPAAALAFEEVLSQKPDLHTAWFGLGAVYDRLGNRDKAIRCYREVLRRQSGFLPALNNLAYLYADTPERRQEAQTLAEKANQAEPDNPWILDTLGYIYFRQGRYDNARAALEKAAARLPDVPTVHYHLALVEKQQGRRDQALRSLRSALDLGPFAETENARKLLEQMTRAKTSGQVK